MHAYAVLGDKAKVGAPDARAAMEARRWPRYREAKDQAELSQPFRRPCHTGQHVECPAFWLSS